MTGESTPMIAEILAVLRERNPVGRAMGIEVVSASVGRLRAAMPVREDMVNSRGSCHGGYIFTLGDQAAGWACMTHNEQAVTQSAHITYVAPAELGEVLTADVEELAKSRRGGTYDVRITGGDGRVVALVRCQFAVIGPVIIGGLQ